MGEPIIDQLQAEGVEVNGFSTTAVSKPPLIEDIARAFEREAARWSDHPIGNADLDAYQRAVCSAGSTPESAPGGWGPEGLVGGLKASE